MTDRDKQEDRKKSSVTITAELGTSHGGSLKKAVDMIHAARDSGADCVKFQWVIAREILHPLTGKVELPGGPVSLYSRFEELEQPPSFYESLKYETEKAGLSFLCSPFGPESLAGLRKLGISEIKIASPELNYYPLLREAAEFASIILSTGVSELEDIKRAVEITGKSTTILHCITSYPAPEDEYNIRTIPFLAKTFGLPAGISDHSMDPELVPALAVTQGAVFIEKHFTLSREDGGLDDPIALTPEDFALMTLKVRETEKLSASDALEAAGESWGTERVKKILGVERKKLAPSETVNYRTTNRSIHALTEIPAGEIISEKNAAILRTEKNLSPGLFPEHWEEVLGMRAKKRIPPGEGILHEYLESAD